MRKAFQELIPNNRCWGCGNLNDGGLQLKSFWEESPKISVASWTPHAAHMAGPPDVLNGGILATIVDCHTICTAIAAAYVSGEREIGEGDPIWYATGSLNVRYQKPTPIDQPVELTARVERVSDRRTNLTCTASSGGVETVAAEVVAVRVPPEWANR